MLNVNRLNVSYSKKGRGILSDVSFSLEKGEIGVLLGPNGAGKSTLFQTLLGTLKPVSGEIFSYIARAFSTSSSGVPIGWGLPVAKR